MLFKAGAPPHRGSLGCMYLRRRGNLASSGPQGLGSRYGSKESFQYLTLFVPFWPFNFP